MAQSDEAEAQVIGVKISRGQAKTRELEETHSLPVARTESCKVPPPLRSQLLTDSPGSVPLVMCP